MLKKKKSDTEFLLATMVSGDVCLSLSEQTTKLGSDADKVDVKDEDTKVDISEAESVGIVGTGNFGKAIASKIESSGLHVVQGSREPGGKFVTVENTLQENLVILAVPMFSWTELPLNKIMPGTVVIDCSNRTKTCPPTHLSQAETLQQLLPGGVHVVKCLNTVSAYELENNTYTAGKQVPIAGDSKAAKEAVGELLEKLGYHVLDMGGLEQARTIENIPLTLFPEWRRPFLISLSLWIFFYFLTFGRYHFVDHNQLGWHGEGLKNMFVKYINKTCDCHALVLLAACYLPGVLAAYIQLGRGTKYSEFPAWLDKWLKMRKQLGVFMLLSASIHACFYVLLYAPHYKHEKIPTPEKDEWDWDNLITVQGEEYPTSLRTNMYLGAGIIAYFIAVILGVTSLPSVSSSLSWKEFRMIQSWLGWLCLVLSTTHCTLNGWKKLYKFQDSFFLGSEQVPLILPAITFVLKIPLLIPMVDSRLTQIRQGKVF